MVIAPKLIADIEEARRKGQNYSHVIFGEPQLLMTQGTGTSLMEHLRQVPDPRIERTRCHELMDLLVIALCAAIGVADN